MHPLGPAALPDGEVCNADTNNSLFKNCGAQGLDSRLAEEFLFAAPAASSAGVRRESLLIWDLQKLLSTHGEPERLVFCWIRL